MRTTILTACLVLAALAARAAGPSATLNELSVGKPMQGPALDRQKLKNRVVVVEFWGFNCPPCRRSLPHLAKWDKEMRDKGLSMIGVHCQNVSSAKVLGLVKKSGVTFPIYSSGGVKGVRFSRIPRLFVFDHNGKMIYTGSPFKAEALIRKAVAAIPPALPGPGKFKKLSYVARGLSSLRNLGSAAKQLQEKTKDTDAATAKEAGILLDRVTKYGEARLQEAEALKQTDPAACLKLYREIAVQFSGCAIGKKATETLDALRKDKQFQAELKAAADMARVRPLESYIKPVGGSTDPKDANVRKRNAAVIQNILNSCQYVIKKHKGTAAAAEARKLHDKYKP